MLNLIETPCDPNFVMGKISKKMLLYRKYTGGLSELISVFPSFTASHDIFSAFDSRHVNANDVHKQRLDKKWATLSQAEKYSIKMQEVPFRLYHKVCLELDILRFDGKDVREFACTQFPIISEDFRRQLKIPEYCRRITSADYRRCPKEKPGRNPKICEFFSSLYSHVNDNFFTV